ncbi:MAG: glycosyltransferase [Armatimonadetes bacterium]|nr:glycosyltransferase [Akkermansiaceae bacterium]
MDFTIVTPNLNYGRFLAQSLASVASQQGVELEHLVMDGGSEDDSAAIAAGFSHHIWCQENDRGMSHAINKGFDRALGDWVMWLNADDRLRPGSLAAILPFLRQCEADIVYGDWNIIGEGGDFIRTVKSPAWSKFVHIHHHCYVASTAAFYRRQSVIAADHRIDEEFRYVMDGEFYARLDVAGKTFLHVPVTIADFRMHGNNTSQRHLGPRSDMHAILASERQHNESRAIRRAYGITLFNDPYLNGLIDGLLWIAARGWKQILKLISRLSGT